MKANSFGTKLLMAVICLAVLSYFGLQTYRYFNDPLTTTVVYPYQVESSVTVTGWVVRQEQVIPDASDGLLRLSRSEGERVSKGGRIAVIYADQASLDRQNDIDALKTQIEQLEYAREASLNSETVLKLDNRISQSILSFRKALTSDRLAASTDRQISELRSLVMKRDYSHSDGEDLEARLESLEGQLKSQRSKAASSTRAVTAPVSGIYSALVDGYESVLTPESAMALKPSELARLAPDGGTSSRLGRIITGETWYYAASMAEADARNLTPGGSVTLRFTKSGSQDLTVQVESVSEPENGRVAVVLSSRYYQAEVTLLRQQSADIIQNTIGGLRVPSSAIRVSEDGRTGLYCVVGMTARFKPVRVVYTDSDGYALVEPDTATDTALLRSGDEVIITARDLYDGKVVG